MTFLQKCDTVLDKYSLKIQRKCYKTFLRFSKNKRPSSYPYISGDSFRALADHIHDETGDLNPVGVKAGDVIFVSQERLPEFFSDTHPKIKSPYILICHNGDKPQIDDAFIKNIDDKIIHFYAQDVLIEHPKITPIPIGLENKYYHSQGVTPLFDKLRRKIKADPPTRRKRIFYNFSISTNPPERTKAKQYFDNHPLLFETVKEFLSPRKHCQKLMDYMFVASPPGQSIESCRNWEALYLSTIPIVKNYACFRYFKKIGLPFWIVNDWSELDNLSEDDLLKQHDKLMSEANFEPLFMDYWKKRILADKMQT